MNNKVPQLNLVFDRRKAASPNKKGLSPKSQLHSCA